MAIQPQQEQPAPKKSTGKGFLAASFSFSFLFHLLLLFILGGIVLVPGYMKRETFKAADVVIPQDLEEPPPPPEEITLEPMGGGGAPSVVDETTPVEELDFSSDAMVDNILVESSPRTINISSSAVVGSPSLSKSFGEGGSGDGGGRGDGVGRGIGSGKGLFGSSVQVNNSLTGILYDLKQPIDSSAKAITSNPAYNQFVKDFIDKENWDSKVLNRYYQAPNKLYATQFFLPMIGAEVAPESFQVADKVKPQHWLIHYSGTITSPYSGRYRFLGIGGEVLIVRVNNQVVLNACHTQVRASNFEWQPKDKPGSYPVFTKLWKSEEVVFGDWIDFQPKKSYAIEILIGERGGGSFYSLLGIQKNGQKLQRAADNTLVFPVFTTNAGPPFLPEYKIGSQGPTAIPPM